MRGVPHKTVQDGPDLISAASTMEAIDGSDDRERNTHRSKDLSRWVSRGRRHGLGVSASIDTQPHLRRLTVNQLLLEVFPVMIPLMAPKPMGRPTEVEVRTG